MANISLYSSNICGLVTKLRGKQSFITSIFFGTRSLIYLEETYITDNDTDQWESEWRGKLFYSSVSAHSMDHAILVLNNFPIDVHCNFKRQCILIVDVELDEENVKTQEVKN